ncbi:MAG: transcriptional regulator BetI [Gammaproteobacteria bacterium]|nr:transcriptional regulator BetI [Gammaproteobacteria bacterium]
MKKDNKNTGARGKREKNKELRRLQLIRATIRSVARRGFAETTMADVTREAGLSLGLINLHFKSKDRLMEETLRHLSGEYESACFAAMASAGPTAADKLRALVELDFSPRVCDRRKLAVWFSFWGEARSRPTYQQICARNDRRYEKIVTDLCQEIIEVGGYAGIRAATVANGLSALVNGLWLDMLMTPDDMPPENARDISVFYLSHAFPNHFANP